MTEEKHEMISALMDGEAGRRTDACVATLARDESLRRAWGRYHVISECMRRGLPRVLDTQLAARVLDALKDEPAILAPRRTLRESVLRPAAGFAIAASVAAVAILGLQQNRSQEGTEIAPQLASSVESPVPSAHQVTFASGRTSSQTSGPRFTSARDNLRLNSYLVNHTEYRSQGAVQGMLPYVRIVAHDVDE